MRSLRWALIQSDWFLKRRGNLDTQRDTRNMHTTRKDHVRAQQEDTICKSRREAPPNQPCQHHDLGLPASICEKVLLFKPPSLWYFWRRKWQPTPVLLPGKSHGRRSLVAYSPWGCKRAGHDWADLQVGGEQRLQDQEEAGPGYPGPIPIPRI